MQLGRHKRILETRLRELSNTLGRRQNIVIERAPDAVDDLELAGERNLAMRSLEKRFAQLRFVEAQRSTGLPQGPTAVASSAMRRSA
jgi:DnaK suppressor protein